VDHVAELQRENAALRKQVAAQSLQIGELTKQIAKMNERLGELLAIAQRKQRPVTVPKPAPPPDVGESEQQAFDARPKAPEKPPAPAREKQKPSPTGRKALPQHLEADEHVLRPSACAHCGGVDLEAAEELVEEKLDVVKEHQRRRKVRRMTCRCRGCGKRTTPRSLPAPYERSKVTSAWLAWLVHSKFVQLMPLDRIRRDLADRGITLAMSTLVSFIERAADLLSPVDGLHWKRLLASPWMATDGTGLKVLIPKLPVAHNGYVELYRNAELAVFQYEADKASESVVSKLSPFRGTLTADAEHRFNAVFASGQVLEAGCNAHGRRKFRDAEATQPVLAVEGGAFIGAIYGEEEKAQIRGLSGDSLRAHRETFMRPLIESFRRWRSAVAPTLLPSEPLAAAVRYYDNHHDALFRFVEDPNVPIDNSPTEREFQNVAKLRLNVLFAGSTEGAHRACVLLGIVATCRALGVPIQAYLAWAFDRLGTHRDVFGLELEQVTPAAFKASIS
jgi:transposase